MTCFIYCSKTNSSTGLGESEHAGLSGETQEMTEAEQDCPVSSDSDLAFSCYLVICYPTNAFFPQAQVRLWKASKNSPKGNLRSLAYAGLLVYSQRGTAMAKATFSFQYLSF